MVREIWVQFQVESYQKLLKWYLMCPCLRLSIIRYVSRVKWSNPGKGEVHPPTPRCSSYWKGNLLVTLDYGRQLYFYFLHTRMLRSIIDIQKITVGSSVWMKATEVNTLLVFERRTLHGGIALCAYFLTRVREPLLEWASGKSLWHKG